MENKSLTSLNLSFVDLRTIYPITSICKRLDELTIRNVEEKTEDFSIILQMLHSFHLKNLKKLNIAKSDSDLIILKSIMNRALFPRLERLTSSINSTVDLKVVLDFCKDPSNKLTHWFCECVRKFQGNLVFNPDSIYPQLVYRNK